MDELDKREITELGVMQIQNAISSIDEVRERLDLPPWGLPETSEPVVFTVEGPVPMSMAPQLIENQQKAGLLEQRIEDLELLVSLLLEYQGLGERIARHRRELGL